MSDGYGACLIEKPQLIADMVKQTRNRLHDIPIENYSVSVKIRLRSSLEKTVDLCRQVHLQSDTRAITNGFVAG
jgi:tRNA-dihydrouridine synthase 4